MATIYRCDRCDRETKDKEEIARIEYPSYSRQSYNRGLTDIVHKELCENCVSSLNDFMKPLAKDGSANVR